MLLITNVSDDCVQIRGKFDETTVRDLADRIRKDLPITNAILMDRVRYDPNTDLSEYHFIVVTNAIEAHTGETYSQIKHNYIGQLMMGETISRFTDAMMAYYDGNTPEEMTTSFACYHPQGAFA